MNPQDTELLNWHIVQAGWALHAAMCGTAVLKPEPTKSLLIATAEKHQRFAQTIRDLVSEIESLRRYEAADEFDK